MVDILTHRRVLKIALPIVLSNATVPLLGAVDTGVVGQLGQAAPIGAVGIGAIILTSIYWIFGFLRMGTVGLTSQALGADDQAEVVALLSRALLIGLAAGAVLIAFQIPIFHQALSIAPASAEVETLARDYMGIRIFSAPAAIAIYGVTGWLIAQERTGGVLVLQVGMNVLNIVLNFVFVLGFDWGVEGVAWATFIAEWSGLALAIWLCRGAFLGTAWRNWDQILEAQRLTRMMLVNIDILIRSVLLLSIFVSFTFWGSDFGDLELAANQILLQFLHITAYALDGFAFAAETLVGRALGSRNRLALRRAAGMTSLWGLGICVGMAAIFYIAGGTIIDIMTTAEPVRILARDYLIYMVLAPILGVAAWMLDGIFIGATRTADMRNMMIITTVIYFASAIVLTSWYGNHGLWIALLISFIARGITLGSRYPALERDVAHV
ncbi:MATE family efflux transporter [Parasulfitobacter algicola]|uniref:MATE family efflux transporter n=1 Tax=Parasulfitobacter algicola TaxID=2614809 RepID=A0ABX2ING6_9RHOB|nr:MATE family efflux transporter [Sulfitobacter algicola]NSX54436.1 MATE family efflux transporter [Sulfitobacter algicola]